MARERNKLQDCHKEKEQLYIKALFFVVHLAKVDEGVEGAAAVKVDVGAQQQLLAGQDVDLDLRHRRAKRTAIIIYQPVSLL